MAEMTEYTADQIVAVDESAANERTRDRKFGWSPQGVPCRVRLPGRRTERWSILPALTVDGWLDYELHQGSFDAERFEAFIERVLEHMNPFPQRHSVLLLDNASIHHSERVTTTCREKGVIMAFLPPYAPDFNPIEIAFHELKEWMRRHRETGYQYSENFDMFIRLAMEQVCEPATARAYLRACGYGDPVD